jgi:hypothetical protein
MLRILRTRLRSARMVDPSNEAEDPSNEAEITTFSSFGPALRPATATAEAEISKNGGSFERG